MSVTQLQARIDELSAEIVRQQEVLADLERRKSAYQRQLNAIRDPVARLPLEISSTIFVHCLPSDPLPDARIPPLLLLNVCNRWTEIALATTELWASINVDDWSDPASLLDTWPKRAGNRGLSISLRQRLPHEITALVGKYAHRLHALKLYHDDGDMDLVTAAGPFPVLKTLTIIGVYAEEFLCSATATLDMLRKCPNAAECMLDEVSYSDDEYVIDMAETEMVVLPRMRHLNFGRHPDSHGCDASILPYLTLPCLQTLFIPWPNLEDLISFLKRSSPPLQQIIVGDGGPSTLYQTEELLSFLPMLTHFELFKPRENTTDQFLTVLTSSPHLLPNLTTIAFQYFDPPGPWYQQLLGFLHARRKQIHTVRIIWRDYRMVGPPADVLGQLRQFLDDGMKIHIGTEDVTDEGSEGGSDGDSQADSQES
ncbi:hypothetical protein B0H17DRAFT_1185793 [Mycena rosella]|uniref:F-box domain-containing protein n=1 Tax=Mycena rosella TaxID=1033263 RepID=A0AAD7G1V2_MYCRO|nr:hypothetical protein B0H17DRAFT_1185793 [Mycena rosella]